MDCRISGPNWHNLVLFGRNFECWKCFLNFFGILAASLLSFSRGEREGERGEGGRGEGGGGRGRRRRTVVNQKLAAQATTTTTKSRNYHQNSKQPPPSRYEAIKKDLIRFDSKRNFL